MSQEDGNQKIGEKSRSRTPSVESEAVEKSQEALESHTRLRSSWELGLTRARYD